MNIKNDITIRKNNKKSGIKNKLSGKIFSKKKFKENIDMMLRFNIRIPKKLSKKS